MSWTEQESLTQSLLQWLYTEDLKKTKKKSAHLLPKTLSYLLTTYPLIFFSSPVFLNPTLFTHWIAAHSSNQKPSNPTRHLHALYKASKNAQPLHIHPEDSKCNVCRNDE
jgi:hypothetical protein